MVGYENDSRETNVVFGSGRVGLRNYMKSERLTRVRCM